VVNRACLIAIALLACRGREHASHEPPAHEAVPAPVPTAPAPKPAAPPPAVTDQPVAAAAVADAKAKLIAKHGEAKRAEIERGVDQVAGLWRAVPRRARW